MGDLYAPRPSVVVDDREPERFGAEKLRFTVSPQLEASAAWRA